MTRYFEVTLYIETDKKMENEEEIEYIINEACSKLEDEKYSVTYKRKEIK